MANMFIKRAQPAARRTARRSRSSGSENDDAPQNPPRRAVRQAPSSDSEGTAGTSLAARRPLKNVSLDVDQDIGAFKVKKTKLSRQMSAQKAPVAMPRRGGLGSTSSNQADGVARRAWKEGETDDVSARVSEDDPMEDNIVFPHCRPYTSERCAYPAK